MKLTNYFNISRFWLLLKMELFRSRKGIVMTFVITFGLLFFVGMILDIVVDSNKVVYDPNANFGSSLIIAGFILSSLAFNDLGNSLKRYHYLTLPASTLEKFLSMWFLTTVGWIILFTLAYTFYTFIANAIGNLLFGRITFLAFNPFSEFSFTSMRSYFVLQGIFLVGAAHFKGYVFPKTLFALILFGAVCGTVIYFSLADIFLTDHYCPGNGYECEFIIKMKKHQASVIAQWLFWWVLAPLCWVVTYFGLKDQEV